MTDARSNRKARVAPFLSSLDKDRQANLLALINIAKKIELEGFEGVKWDEETWIIDAGRLIQSPGRNTSKVTLHFQLPAKTGGGFLPKQWGDTIKALFLLRFHRNNQALSNQWVFISSVS